MSTNLANYNELDERQASMLSCPSMKSMQIITALVYSEESSLTVSELSATTGLSASTVHRILQELLSCNFVAKDESSRKYRIGSETLILAMRIKTSGFLLEMAAPEMRRLNEITGETVHLLVRVDDLCTYIGKIETKHSIGIRSKIGGKKPLSCTSGGKAILAFEPEKWVEEYLNSTPLKQYTDYTIVDRKAFELELENIRRQGYALDNRENNPEVQCIAVPLFSGDNVVGALSVAAPHYRFPVSLAMEFKDEIIKSGNIVSENLSVHTYKSKRQNASLNILL